MSKSLKKNLAFNILLNVSNVIFPLITAPYVARVILPDGLGLYNFAMTFAGYFALVAILGIPTYGVREVAKYRDNIGKLHSLVSEIFTINIISTIITSILFIITIYVVPQLYDNFLFFVVAGIVIYTKPFSVEWFFQGMEQFGFITIRSLLIRFLGIVGLFTFVHDKEDLFLYLLISVISTIASQIWNFAMLIRSGIKPMIVCSGLKKHIKPLLLLFSSSVAISIYTVLDTIMLGFISSYSEVAYYNNATHISKSFLAIVTSLSIVAMPRLSNYLSKGNWDEINSLIKKSLSIVSFLAIPITFGIVCVAPEFIPMFLGSSFQGAVIPLQIMAFVIISIGFNNLTGVQILVGLGHDKLFLYSVLVGTFSNFTLNLFLIPSLGAIGASLASVIAETLILFVTTYYVLRKTQVKLYGTKDVYKSVVAASSFFPIAYIFNQYTDGFTFTLLVTISCIISYVVIQHMMKSDSLLLFKEIIIKKIKR